MQWQVTERAMSKKKIIISQENSVQRLLSGVICHLRWSCWECVSLKEASKAVMAWMAMQLKVRFVHVKGWTTNPSVAEKEILYNHSDGSSFSTSSCPQILKAAKELLGLIFKTIYKAVSISM